MRWRGRTPALSWCDVDTQANASYSLVGKRLPEILDNGSTIDVFLEDALTAARLKKPFSQYIQRNVSNLELGRSKSQIALLPSSTHLRVAERRLMTSLLERSRTLDAVEVEIQQTLQKQLRTIEGEFKYILFDCAPGISPFTSAAIGLADLVIVPTVPDFLSHLGLTAFLATFKGQLPHEAAARGPQVLFTRSMARLGVKSLMFDYKKKKRIARNLHKEYEDLIIKASRKSGSGFGVLKSTLDETPLMPAAMQLGSEVGKTITFGLKYPDPLSGALEKLKDEIVGILK